MTGDIRIVVEAYQTLHLRCLCPECLRLDALYPGEGYQLALFPYRRATTPGQAAKPRRRFGTVLPTHDYWSSPSDR